MGFQSEDNGGGGSNYPDGTLFYRALISQAGVGAPTVIVLQNTLGGAVVWSYSGAGNYLGTLSGAFPENKTTYQIVSQQGPLAWNQITWASVNNIAVASALADGTGVDDVLVKCPIEIIVFP